MQWTGHVGLALLAYAPLVYGLTARRPDARVWVGLLALLPFAVAPDVDLYVAALPHRGLTHTVWAVGACGLVGAALGGAIADRRVPWWLGGAVGLVGTGSHLLGDALTPMGLVPVAPWSGTVVSLNLVRSANVEVNGLLLAGGVVVFAVAAGRPWLVARAGGRTSADGG